MVGGLGTWIVAPAGTDHIGASGLVFGFASYLIARGAFSLIPTPGVSWQDHLFGAIGGVLAARLLDRGHRLAGDSRAPVTA